MPTEIGVLACWLSGIVSSLGAVLMKYHETNNRLCGPSWKVIGLCLTILASLLDLVAFSFLPVAIIAIHACFPIILGEIFSSALLKKSLNWKQWIFIIMIVPCVAVAVFYGPREDSKHHVTETFQHSMQQSSAIIIASSWLLFIFLASHLTKHLSLKNYRDPRALCNIVGPVVAASVGAFTIILSKLFSETISFWALGIDQCGKDASKGCVESLPNWFGVFIVVAPIFAAWHLYWITFIMGKLKLVVVIPWYGSLMILLPLFLAMVIFEEKPTQPSIFFLSVLGMLIFNVCFLIVSPEDEKKIDKHECQAHHEVEIV